MNVGILGGTFDPPHNGHLLIAHAARRALGLTRIVFIPAKQPPHKLHETVSPLADRLAMLELALQAHPEFVISLVEVERAGPSYTVDTLRELRRAVPPPAEIFFIMGMDSLENLPTWREPQAIVQLCKLAVLKRPGYAVDWDALEAKAPGVRDRVVLIAAPETDVSASQIRERAAAGGSLEGLVPPAVAAYIRAQHLYQTE